MKSFAKKTRGFTIIELMIALAIIAVLTLVIFGRVQAAKMASQVQGEAGNVQSVIAASQRAFIGRSNFTGLTNTFLTNVNGFPTQMMNGTQPVHTWGGNVTVTTATVPAANTAKGQIVYADVPTDACVEFVNAVSSSLQHIDVGGTAVKTAGDTVNDLDATTTQCGANDLVTVTMVFSN